MSSNTALVQHTFHIPVMGTGFTIDTPLHVARYGISSVISLVDDVLIEQMRKHHCLNSGEPYEEITEDDSDPRANRITAYLNLLHRLLQKQQKELQASPFETGSEITRYFELLPDNSLKGSYNEMLEESDPDKKIMMQDELRGKTVSGSIDVNIMTKLDRETYRNNEKLPPEYADAMSALRGFAQSDLISSIVCSAGMNRRFYTYFCEFTDFYPDDNNTLKKKIILKVSDYRSAFIQGKFLAQRGLWVSEFRIESGLNCGGHAFASQGYLLGPILEKFKQHKKELIEILHEKYNKGLASKGLLSLSNPLEQKITVQGGIGTSDEDNLMQNYYHVDGTGWGTPFMLVAEVTNLDDRHLELLVKATEDDVFLSDSSPLGVPFWNLRTSASENKRRTRIDSGKPGSPCPKGLISFNTEFTEKPICTASRAYQFNKLKQLSGNDYSIEQYEILKKYILDKSCICHDLGGSATVKNNIDPDATAAVCCGPNIVNFNSTYSLEEMVDHIYGRISLITNNARPHMFIKELSIYVDYLKDEIEHQALQLSERSQGYFTKFKENLLEGVEYYSSFANTFVDDQKSRFLEDLESLRVEIETMQLTPILDT